MGKSTISMVIFNSFLYVYQRVEFPWNLEMTSTRGALRFHKLPGKDTCMGTFVEKQKKMVTGPILKPW